MDVAAPNEAGVTTFLAGVPQLRLQGGAVVPAGERIVLGGEPEALLGLDPRGDLLNGADDPDETSVCGPD